MKPSTAIHLYHATTASLVSAAIMLAIVVLLATIFTPAQW